MKSFPLLCTGTLFVLLLKYGYAVTLWNCYHWTASDLHSINARGGDQEAERYVCKVILGHVFTGGNDTETPGCGVCWCCQKRENPWKCNATRTKALGGGKMVAHEVRDGKTDHLFTAGQNKLTPGSWMWVMLALSKVPMDTFTITDYKTYWTIHYLFSSTLNVKRDMTRCVT